jgi:hypothetical protein
VCPPEEDIELLRHFSQKLLDPPVIISNDKNNENMGKTVVPPDLKKLRARKVKRDDDDVREAEVCKRSVIYDDDEESDEKRKINLKRKRVLSNSKIIAKHLAKSITKPPNSLPVAFVAILNAYSELIEGDQFFDINKTVVTYVLDVFKCPDGYISSQIYKEVVKIPGWSIPIAILSALVFTIIINSFWPMLISMFHSLKRILSETFGIAKTVEKIQDNQEHCVELINILSAKQPSVSKPTSSSDACISLSKKSVNPYCLWCWVIVCIFSGFMAALFIAAVFLSLIISLTDPVMEPQCEKIERQLSNGETSSWGVTSIAASILSQYDNGTTLIMPCDGIALDEVGKISD